MTCHDAEGYDRHDPPREAVHRLPSGATACESCFDRLVGGGARRPVVTRPIGDAGRSDAVWVAGFNESQRNGG